MSTLNAYEYLMHICICDVSVPDPGVQRQGFYDRCVWCVSPRCVRRQGSYCCVRDSAVELFTYSVSASERPPKDASSARSALKVSLEKISSPP